MAVLIAEAWMAGLKNTMRGVLPTVAPVTEAMVNVCVPPIMPVTVTTTAEPAVAPVPVTLKPEIQLRRPETAAIVAVAVAAATLPEVTLTCVAPIGRGEADAGMIVSYCERSPRAETLNPIVIAGWRGLGSGGEWMNGFGFLRASRSDAHADGFRQRCKARSAHPCTQLDQPNLSGSLRADR